MFTFNINANIRIVEEASSEELARIHLKLDRLISQQETIMADQAEIVVQIQQIQNKLTKIGTETTSLLTKIAELTAIIAAGPVSPELQQAVNDLTAQAQVVDDLVADAPDVPPTP